MAILATLHASADYEATLPLGCDPAWGLTDEQQAAYLRDSDPGAWPDPGPDVDRVTVRTLSEAGRVAIEDEVGAAPIVQPGDVSGEERVKAQRAWSAYFRAMSIATIRQGCVRLGDLEGAAVAGWIEGRARSAMLTALLTEVVAHIRNVGELGEVGKARFASAAGKAATSDATDGTAPTAENSDSSSFEAHAGAHSLPEIEAALAGS